MADDIATKSDLDELKMLFTKFVDKYDIDMRGDGNSNNGGRRGVIGNIRELRKCQSEYPSITWLLAHRPAKTWASIVGVFVVLSSLMTVGVLNVLGAMFGLYIPVP